MDVKTDSKNPEFKHNVVSRRKWIRLFSATPLVAWLAPGTSAQLAKTAAATEGPFYPEPSMRKIDIDNDLVKIDQNVKQAGGEIVYLTGSVTDTDANPLSGLRIEIWQCDTNGRYLHTGDDNRAERDVDFQGFGHTVTDQSGQFEFRTIKPVSYPGRTPHIHVKIFRNDTVLTTQFYIRNHPDNAADGLFNRMSPAQRASVEMDFSEHNGNLTAHVNVVC